ncbi:signal recognition particle, SRP9/SRP14 subunit [Macroventuria anomochaeta]|uniref:Signal recognition particle, SRP9/SRP14 subunit n=1 Tax=Macroventuria anomochaeta TaxID=301207 RepID=A0ACB6SDS9_9PLEO|nr:signal recognition particle, SRP9/SRP14 subunit [Macroventuria anomochaeta]KAF2631647.1 signal recognition particle, SRP9/SRP14 subunit [Macroventuria anomochaeta]
MGREHLSNDEFFTQLGNLFEHNRKKGHGSVYLTQKRLIFDSASTPATPTKVADDPLWDTHPENPLPVLIRASNNASDKKAGTERQDVAKIVLSTIVEPGDIDTFYIRYAEACKAGMSSLKKRDRKKGKKDKKRKKVAV